MERNVFALFSCVLLSLLFSFTSYSQGKISDQALAFTFMEMNAVIEHDSLKVNWVSYEEQQLQNFKIQLSKDGAKFTNVSSLPAKVKDGSTTVSLHYNYEICLRNTKVVFGSVSFLIIFLLLLSFLQKKRLALLFTVPLVFIFLSCTKTFEKNDPLVDYSDIKFLRVEVLDKNNNIGYSKIIKVVDVD